MTHLSANVNKDRTISLYEGAKKVFRGSIEEIAAFLSGTNDLAPSKRQAKRVQPLSRPKRWSVAASAAVAALEELKEIQEEYSEWKDSLPENLQNSPVAEKLDQIVDLDLESAIEMAQEAENADLPLGFGRD